MEMDLFGDTFNVPLLQRARELKSGSTADGNEVIGRSHTCNSLQLFITRLFLTTFIWVEHSGSANSPSYSEISLSAGLSDLVGGEFQSSSRRGR